jgi:hypothetical protein
LEGLELQFHSLKWPSNAGSDRSGVILEGPFYHWNWAFKRPEQPYMELRSFTFSKLRRSDPLHIVSLGCSHANGLYVGLKAKKGGLHAK